MEARGGLVNRFTTWAEIGAGMFLAMVMLLTFAAVVLRHLFNISIPDSYDISRNLLGILIFWGIAVTSFRGEHITVDFAWRALPPKGKRMLDLVGIAFTLLCMAAFCWAMAGRTLDVLHTGEATYDTGMPIWPFYTLAWLGTVAAVVLVAIRLVRHLCNPQTDKSVPMTPSH